MTLRKDILNALDKWCEKWCEFGNGCDWDETNIGFCFSQYEGHGDGLFVEEQWYASVDALRIWLELDGIDAKGEEFTWPEAIVYDFMDGDEMVEFIESMTFDGLIGEADCFIEEHELKEA